MMKFFQFPVNSLVVNIIREIITIEKVPNEINNNNFSIKFSIMREKENAKLIFIIKLYRMVKKLGLVRFSKLISLLKEKRCGLRILL